jgi:hypothetical protein
MTIILSASPHIFLDILRKNLLYEQILQNDRQLPQIYAPSKCIQYVLLNV